MADDSILDYLSNNWSQLLGINQPQGGAPMAGQPAAPPQGGGPMAGAPPLPPPSAMANNGQFSPNTVQGGPLLSAADQGAALSIPPSAVVQPGGYGATGGGPNANLPMPIPGGPGSAAAAVNPSAVPPSNLNLPLPLGPPQGGGPMAMIPTSTGPATPGPPMNIQPPPARAMNNPPPTMTTGSLAQAFGLRQNPTNPWAGFAAGVGRGLTAVGNARPGASGAQMFSAGAGGGLTGSTDFLEKQQQSHFNDLSTAFRDTIASKALDNQTAFNEAQTRLANARAAMVESGGGTGNSVGNILRTPEGKIAFAYQRGKDAEENERKTQEANVHAGTQVAVDGDAVTAAGEKRRNEVLKSFGMDPDQAQKIQTRGQMIGNPYPYKPGPIAQFEKTVPIGAYYDSGQKYGKDGSFKLANGQTVTGKPGAPVILKNQGTPTQRQQAAAAQQSNLATTQGNPAVADAQTALTAAQQPQAPVPQETEEEALERQNTMAQNSQALQ